MPLARIDLARGKSADYRATIGQVVYEAMEATLHVPNGDHFHVIAEHPGESFVADPDYLVHPEIQGLCLHPGDTQ